MVPAITLNVHPVGNQFLVKTKINADIMARTIATIFCLFVDISGSMGDTPPVFFAELMPMFFRKLGMKPDDEVMVITYESTARFYKIRVKDFSATNIRCAGGTDMICGLRMLQDKLSSFPEGTNLRFLHVSDGAVNDQQGSVILAEALCKHMSRFRLINSHALGFGSGADTRALCSTMRWGNHCESRLITSPHLRASHFRDISFVRDISSVNMDTLSSDMVQLYINDGLGQSMMLSSKTGLFTNPWSTIEMHTIPIVNDGSFWSKTLPTAEQFDTAVKVDVGEPMTSANHLAMFGHHMIETMKSTVRGLKVIGTAKCQEDLKPIKLWLKELDGYLTTIDVAEVTMYDRTLQGRIATVRRQVRKSTVGFVLQMQEIVNAELAAGISNAALADFFTQKVGKSAAKRMVRSGGDEFDSKFLDAIRRLVDNIDQLKTKIGDDDLDTTELSLATIIDGLEALKNFDDLTELTMEQLSTLLVVPGYAFTHKGDVYAMADGSQIDIDNINCIHNRITSVADLLDYHQTMKVHQPLTGNPDIAVTGCIPVFHPAVLQYIRDQKAWIVLDVLANASMCHTVGYVPSMHMYLVAAALKWLLREFANGNVTEYYVEMASRLFSNLDATVGTKFATVEAGLKESAKDKAFFIPKSGDHVMGVLDMLPMMMRMIKAGEKTKVVAIVRTLMCNEAYTTLKPVRMSKEYNLDATMSSLTGVTEADSTPVGDPFTIDVKSDTNKQVCINSDALQTLTEPFQNMFWVSKLVPMLEIFAQNESVGDCQKALKAMPPTSDEFVYDALNLSYGDLSPAERVEILKFFLVFQALNNIKHRSDDVANEMTFRDIGTRKAFRDSKIWVINYLNNIFDRNTQSKRMAEQDILAKEMVQMASKCSIKEFNRMLRDGICYRDGTYIIRRPDDADDKNWCFFLRNKDHSIVPEMMTMVTDPTTTDRTLKFTAFVMAQAWSTSSLLPLKFNPDEDVPESTVIWNGGNPLAIKDDEWDKYKDLFTPTTYELFKQVHAKCSRHRYRVSDNPNRHGHCNSNPSWWALGFETIGEMKDNVLADAWLKYLAEREKNTNHKWKYKY